MKYLSVAVFALLYSHADAAKLRRGSYISSIKELDDAESDAYDPKYKTEALVDEDLDGMTTFSQEFADGVYKNAKEEQKKKQILKQQQLANSKIPHAVVQIPDEEVTLKDLDELTGYDRNLLQTSANIQNGAKRSSYISSVQEFSDADGDAFDPNYKFEDIVDDDLDQYTSFADDFADEVYNKSKQRQEYYANLKYENEKPKPAQKPIAAVQKDENAEPTIDDLNMFDGFSNDKDNEYIQTSLTAHELGAYVDRITGPEDLANIELMQKERVLAGFDSVYSDQDYTIQMIGEATKVDNTLTSDEKWFKEYEENEA